MEKNSLPFKKFRYKILVIYFRKSSNSYGFYQKSIKSTINFFSQIFSLKKKFSSVGEKPKTRLAAKIYPGQFYPTYGWAIT